MMLDVRERQACEELAAPPGSEFAVIYPYLRGPSKERLLATEALFRSLRDIPLTVSDPAVGVAKLAWWQKELAVAPDVGSQHPVVQALVKTGGIELVGSDAFNSYLHALVTKLQDEPIGSGEALGRSLDETAGMEARMLAGDTLRDERSVDAAGRAARLLELMNALAKGEQEPSWLPLDLRARHGFRADSDANEAVIAGIVRDLVALALGWREEVPLAVHECTTAGAGFLALRDAVVGRRLAAAGRKPASLIQGRRAPSPGDAFSAWRAARRVPWSVRGEG